jgi:hypothetical protein
MMLAVRLFLNSHRPLKKGENVTRVDLSKLDKGIYYIRFRAEEGELWSTKVVRL